MFANVGGIDKGAFGACSLKFSTGFRTGNLKGVFSKVGR